MELNTYKRSWAYPGNLLVEFLIRVIAEICGRSFLFPASSAPLREASLGCGLTVPSFSAFSVAQKKGHPRAVARDSIVKNPYCPVILRQAYT